MTEVRTVVALRRIGVPREEPPAAPPPAPPPARRRMVLAVAAALVLAAGGAMLVLDRAGDRTATPAEAGVVSPVLPTGFRWESSLGVEVAVPGGWGVNALQCNVVTGPSLVRAAGATEACAMPDSGVDYVETAGYGDGGVVAATTGFPPTAAPRIGPDQDALTEEQVAAGVTSGFVIVDDVKVRVRVGDPELARRIVASVHRVEVDHNGCRTRLAAHPRPTQAAAAPLLPADVTSAVVCLYAGGRLDGSRPGPLAASVRLSAAEVAELVEVVRTAPPGLNPDVDGTRCAETGQPVPDAVVLAAGQSGPPVELRVGYTHCARRGVDDGAAAVQVTQRLVLLIGRLVHTTVWFVGDLPE